VELREGPVVPLAAEVPLAGKAAPRETANPPLLPPLAAAARLVDARSMRSKKTQLARTARHGGATMRPLVDDGLGPR